MRAKYIYPTCFVAHLEMKVVYSALSEERPGYL